MMNAVQSLEEKKVELCHLGALAYGKGMVAGSGGNISFREGNGIYITPSGYPLDAVRPQDLIFVDMNGAYEGSVRPSIETALHLVCYAARPDVQAIFHLHSYYSILAGLRAQVGCENAMPAYTGSYACKVGVATVAPLYPSGAKALNDAVAASLSRCSAVLLKNHGVVCCGASLRKAFSLCEDVEMNARLHDALQGAGALTGEQIKSLRP